VLDVGCGTGNAALLAPARGATVTGVDPAARLLDVARARAIDHGLDITFSLGEAAALPIQSGSVDVLLSVFGVIFAPDPVTAAAEMARVTAPHGFSVDIEPRSHVFTAASIDDFLREELIDHPLGTASRAMLEARGKTDVQDEIVDRARELLTAGNEQPDGFAVTRPYVVAVARRS
jgi:ubiquinone/menaquinone biosynthesis C-methylase UbiE